ncbi:FemAB family XrtA/PEP-CTERM system-associated protein [Novosphingobium mangrovi (ex Huang et al. 2023)]|uniref:FemAB family PEP-CTERM system-associated protein n=1 Tax=Novosphingobium mangrovi (ex Huang et al. 2023) TaxID=2976432 RepID=A0ABT2I5A0_9SPHN|nr:FemAB family XrtA/PEP-CTERM system-associated protein [Novosphingobium mangrovi (ex Huang et al. 2023)]MCT2399982.1 FemAB family PEP-CTERM system-associated protein [Novosphingobium mangrovi (ex Huang et al. 2023)]
MNAPFAPTRSSVRTVDLADPGEVDRLEGFVARHPQGTPFHRPAWFVSVARATRNKAYALVQERHGEIVAFLPVDAIHSPVFGRVLASTGFAVGGGLLTCEGAEPEAMFAAVEELARRVSCPSIELRGGLLPDEANGWALKTESHCNFAKPLAGDDDAQLVSIPRKQRAEVRKSLANDLTVEVGTAESDRAAHYAVFCESYRNLGTPVFPRALLDSVIDGFGKDADILTVRHQGRAVASVISVYHGGAVMPYWGGGTWDARRLRANDRMYYELMLHARRRGCTTFDFGRSKTGSGAYHFKRNWGFEPEPLTYATWTQPGTAAREADPTSAKLSLQIAVWQRLPLSVANRLGPLIARGIG